MNSDKKFFSPDRIASLSDGIFAIAMTILVLNITTPDKELVAKIGLFAALVEQLQEFYTYFISFFLLSIFWRIQIKQMSVIDKSNSTSIWLNILLLMFICLIPFSASLMSTYDNNLVSTIIFNGNMLIIGLFNFINWHYATKDHRLVPKEYSIENIKKGKVNVLIFIFVTIIAIIIGLFTPTYSAITFLLIPVLKSIIK